MKENSEFGIQREEGEEELRILNRGGFYGKEKKRTYCF